MVTPGFFGKKHQILVFSNIMHSCNFLLQITRLKARGRKTQPHTSKREQCYSPANNQNSLPIWDPAAGCRFFQTESQNCPQSTCCCYCDNTLGTSTSGGKQFQPTSSVGGFAAAGRRSRNLRVTRCAQFPLLLPLTEGISALQTPGPGQLRPTAARTPKVASHPAAPHDSRQCRRHQSRRSREVLQPSGPEPPSPRRVPRPEMGVGGREREAGWRLLWAAGEGKEERRKRRAGAELCQLLPPPLGPRAGPAPL